MNPIEIRRLTKVYRGKRGRRVLALQGLDLNLRQGEVFGFLGPNGAGKSTTIKVLTGQIVATSGDAKLFGLPVLDVNCRRRLGYLPENPSFYEFLSAREVLRFSGSVHGMAGRVLDAAVDRVLDRMDLTEAAARPVRGYSKGMVQRLGLAHALMHDPDLYILDEPMSGLDPLGRALVKDVICELKQRGKTVFFSTHITSDVESVCDRVGIIVRGSLRVDAIVEELLRQGLEGYSLSIRHHNGLREERWVEPSQLQATISEIVSTGGALDQLLPRRRGLDAVFIDVVKELE